MIIARFNDIQDLSMYLKKKIDDHFFTDISSDPELISLIQSSNLYSSNFTHYYLGNKTSLKNNVFDDLLPSLKDSLINSFISEVTTLGSYYLVPTNISFYNIFHSLDNEDIDYSAYFSDIKSIITKLTNDNKFYRKTITDLNVEVVELRRQNADLHQQLNIKSISTWG